VDVSNIPYDEIEWFSFKPPLNIGSKHGKTSVVGGNILKNHTIIEQILQTLRPNWARLRLIVSFAIRTCSPRAHHRERI